MPSFTLDTNCLIAIDETRPEAEFVRVLSDAHADQSARVAVVAISASERQQGGGYIGDYTEFRARMATLDLAHLEALQPMAYLDITFFDWFVWSDEAMQKLEQDIHAVLFPDVPLSWQDYCQAHSLDPASTPAGKWRNCTCDVQAI
jgi:hypothetical protein